MRLFGAFLSLWLLLTNCPILSSQELDERNFAAGQLWEKGQAAMREGRPDDAIQSYEQSLAIDPRMVCNHLSLATAYLEKKNSNSACEHLGIYLDARPGQFVLRFRYAELLARVDKTAAARGELERLVAEIQEEGDAANQNIIHAHERLMQWAENDHDEYDEHLHRGIGLFLLARKRSTLGDPEGELPCESLLCHAAAELTKARLARPEEARPCWYLFEVWSQLGQRLPAVAQLKQAQAASPFTYLTPAEQRALNFAYERYISELQQK
jgi:tetratricopeptide (TPR) repeat protein